MKRYLVIKEGDIYESGRGVVEDVQEAVNWYRKADDLGDSTAMAGLARADVITTGDLDPGVTGMQDDPWTVGYWSGWPPTFNLYVGNHGSGML